MLRSPLSVRIVNESGDVSITRKLADLEYSTTAYGGFDTASFELAKPITDPPEELSVESKVYVYDRRNGRTVWEGRLTDPGRSFSDQGHKWSMTAMGPKKHASDRYSPYIAIDNNLEAWRQTFSAIPEATVTVASGLPNAEDTSCLLFSWPRGVAIANGDVINCRYDPITQAGQKIGAFAFTHVDGFNAGGGNWQMIGYSRKIGTGDTVCRTNNYSTTPNTVADTNAGGGVMGTTEDQVGLRAKHNAAATNETTDTNWAAVTAVWVTALLYDRTGTAITGASAYPTGYLTADWIVTDLLVRFLPQYDVANATIDAMTYQIDQFAYPTGARPSDMFDDLLLTSPTKRWGAWETNKATGKYRFEFTGWGTFPRYEATSGDGIDLPGSSVDIYNRVTVQGLDARGRKQSVTRTSTVDSLDQAGIVREAEPIDLGTEVFSVTMATRVGDQFLQQSATPAASGTLTVRRPIRDLLTGRMVRPWEIRADGLIRVRGLKPSSTGPTATDRDGTSVFRLAGTTFRDSDQAAVCTLDSPGYTIEQLLARVARRRQRR